MIDSHIIAGIRQKFPHVPTEDQENAMQALAGFLNHRSPDSSSCSGDMPVRENPRWWLHWCASWKSGDSLWC